MEKDLAVGLCQAETDIPELVKLSQRGREKIFELVFCHEPPFNSAREATR